MKQTLAALLTVVGLLLAFSGKLELALAGVVLLAIAAALVLRHPEWTEQ